MSVDADSSLPGVSDTDLDVVLIGPHHFQQLVSHPGPIHVDVYPEGLHQHARHRFVQSYIRDMEQSRTVHDIFTSAQSLHDRWMETGLFRDIRPMLEPAAEGGNNVIVKLHVEESAGKKKLGLSTDHTGSPELSASVANLFGRPYTVIFEYLPTNLTRSVSSVTARVQSFDPWIGRILEYSVSRANHDHGTLHSADTETRTEGSVSLAAGNTLSRHKVSLGVTQSLVQSVTPKGIIPEAVMPYVDGPLAKRLHVAAKYEWIRNRLGFHSNSTLYQYYSHPIAGYEARLRAEVSGLGPVPGDTRDIRVEGFVARHFPLGRYLTLGLSGKWGAQFPLPGGPTPPPLPHILDRYYLGGAHVRGYKFVGPFAASGVPDELHDIHNSDAKGGKGKRVVDQLGGTLIGAVSASLGFPIPLLQGVVAGHLFANSGFVGDVAPLTAATSWPQFQGLVRNIASTCVSSVGAGVLINQVPLFGAVHGRIEFNVALPVVREVGSPYGVTVLRNPNPRVFDRVKFGMNWTYD